MRGPTHTSSLHVYNHWVMWCSSSSSIGKGTGYKASELASLDEGHTLVIGGKEIEVWIKNMHRNWALHHYIGLVSDETYPSLITCMCL